MGTLHDLENLLARQRFQLGSVRLNDVDGMTPGAGFLKRTVENRLGAGAPDAGLDAVLLLVGLDDRIEVGRLRRRIDGDLALSLRAFDEALGAIGPSHNARSAVVAPVAAGAEPDPQLAANMASATMATATRWCLRIASTLSG